MVPPSDSVNQQIQLTKQDSINHRIQEENNRELREIESDIKGLAEIYLTFPELLQQQGEDLTLVETSVETTRSHAEKANEYLEKAAKTKSKTRHLQKCTVLGGAVGTAIGIVSFAIFPPGASLAILAGGTALGLGAGAGVGLKKKA